MMNVTVRTAFLDDAESILALFLQQFPFLRECKERALKDVIHRIERDDSMSVVAVSDGHVVGVARAYEQNGIYLMNSMCTSSSMSLIHRSAVLMSLIPFFIRSSIEHAESLGLTKAFYGTDIKSIARLVPVLCNINGYSSAPGHYESEDGFWIEKKGRGV